MTPPAPREEGMILLNVLLIVALASGIVALLLAGEDLSLQRSTRIAEAARADAAATGGELTALAALRRDDATAPDVDSLAEPWARIGDRDAPIEGGSFTLAVVDAQAKFNLNDLANNDAGAGQLLVRIAAFAGLPADLPTRIAALIATVGPLSAIDQLGLVGATPAEIAVLARYATVLPGVTKVNVNTASPALIGILLDNPLAGRLLAARRASQGFLTAGDVSAIKALPATAAFSSGFFWTETRVRIGHTTRTRISLIRRRKVVARREVAVIGRWIGSNAPADVPPLPPPLKAQGGAA